MIFSVGCYQPDSEFTEYGSHHDWCLIVKVKVKLLSCVRHFATPWTVAYQVPPSMGFSRQEYWSGLPFPSPEDLPSPGIEPVSLASPALTGGFFTTEPHV